MTVTRGAVLTPSVAQVLRSTSSLAAEPPPTEILVLEKHDSFWCDVRWRVGTQEDLRLGLSCGRLLELDGDGRVVGNVLSRADLQPGATYVFCEADTSDVAGAVRDVASGHKHESTAAIAEDARLCRAFGPLRVFNGGQPYTFRTAVAAILQVDGLVLAQRPQLHRRLVIANEAKLAPQPDDVNDTLSRAVLLEAILCGKIAVTNFPAELEAYRSARVVPFLSGASFDP